MRKPQQTTADDSLLLFPELSPAEVRAAQRRLKEEGLHRIADGVLTGRPTDEWPGLIARHRIQVLAALFPGAVIGFRSAFHGGVPVEGVMHLTFSRSRKLELPGLVVQTVKGTGKAPGDAPMMGRELYFPSVARLLLENLTVSRGPLRKSVGRAAVEERLLTIGESRGEGALSALREEARTLAPSLGFERERRVLDGLIDGILGTRKGPMATAAGKALVAAVPYNSKRLELFELLAAELRSAPLKQPAAVVKTEKARTHFAFLESYFSNFIEGTEFDIRQARGFVLDGTPIAERHKDGT